MHTKNSKPNFAESLRKSRFIFQYHCCGNYWWGTQKNNICNRCKKNKEKLPLEKMLGIGWFECNCRRKYAGFCRGDVPSKCLNCDEKNLASFIVPGDRADKDEKTDKAHHCEKCNGSYDCPVVAQLRTHKSRY